MKYLLLCFLGILLLITAFTCYHILSIFVIPIAFIGGYMTSYYGLKFIDYAIASRKR